MPAASRTWSFNRLLVLLLTLGYVTLALDIRYEHTDVVRHHWTAWIPIVYSLVMVALGFLGVALWGRVTRHVLFWAFAVGIVVGSAGLWFHTDGQLRDSIAEVLSAWVRHVPHEDEPPPLAPLAFCGMALMGMAACLGCFQPRPAVADAEIQVR